MLKLGYDVRHEDISGLTLECLCRPWSQHDDATPSRMLTCTLGVERSSFIGTGFSMQGVKSQVSHLRQGRWTGLVLCWKNSSKSPWRIWEAMYSLKKREQSLFRADICSCFVDFSVTGGRLRRWRLFRLMGCDRHCLVHKPVFNICLILLESKFLRLPHCVCHCCVHNVSAVEYKTITAVFSELVPHLFHGSA